MVTWVEQSFFTQEVVDSIYRSLVSSGRFIFDDRNPNHFRTSRRGGNWRTWKEQDGVFYLERHETDEGTGVREDVWITVDLEKALITEKFGRFTPISLDDKLDMLRCAGFSPVKLCTMQGAALAEENGPYCPV